MKPRLFLMCFLLLVAACTEPGPSGGRVCSTEARVGLQISVRDARAGLPAANNVVATAQDINFIDTLRTFPFGNPDSALTLHGVYERAGVYTVILRKVGYQDWIRTDVIVNRDECHVITVQLDARLQPN